MIIQMVNDYRHIKEFQNKEKTPTITRLAIFSFDIDESGKWINIQLQTETNRFSWENNQLIAEGLQLTGNNFTYFLLNEHCSNDYIKGLIEAQFWPADAFDQMYKH